MPAPSPKAAAPRRRLPWRRDAAASSPRPPRSPRQPRRPFDYAPAARPESQPALATRLPTRPGGLAAAVVAILLVAGGAIALGAVPAALDAPARLLGPRFARSLAMVRGMVEPRDARLVGWLAEMFLLGAAAVALAIRGMRHHRRDGRQGRSGGWLALALVLAGGAAAVALPLGRLVSALLTDATGIEPGPGGAGWWVFVAGTTLIATVLWTTLPLHQRLGPALWWTVALGCLATSAAVPWLGGSVAWGAIRIEPVLVAPAVVLSGAAASLIAVLVAARGVIREVRGAIGAPPVPAPAAAAVKGAPTPPPAVREVPVAAVAEPHFEPLEEDDDDADTASDSTRYTDGSELEEEYASRPLSKAEKKRLRKLARSGHAA